MRFEKLVRPTVKDIKEYVPGKSIEEIAKKYGLDPATIIKLGSNENPLGASPLAVLAIKEKAPGVHLYPQADALELRKAIGDHTGYPVSNIVVSGNGMDGIFDTMMRLFMSPGAESIIPIPTFSYYEISTLANGGKPVFVERDPDFSISPEKILGKVNENTSLIFLCSPNNPSGNSIPEKDVRKILDSTDAIVFIDEAYVEFAGSSITGLVREYENLIVGRTFSKAFGLAGMRMGYAIVPEWIARVYMKVMTPFSMDVLSTAAGLAALKDREYLNKSIETVKKGRMQLSGALGSLCKVYPSDANFIMIDVSPRSAKEVSESLLRKGIIIRDCTSFRGAGKSLIRISVGTEVQNEKVIEAFREIL
ncbi:MAG: histidinol-phosphate aminotransferase [Candidatus Methanoperedens nitroreducens]|uniref:Histidinol-phosphate aminotransferase n=1 Tax=Candidatus Methanoperedens nitratireducens TaxID=1392998 RepID=A0A0P8A3Y1_9EURY|nr:histidinol-phosphate transaminase [Candidatus Methanoperedens sp. BLZ2]KAB2945123.1 MAG: histidinol-phosphate transaminase [Candidatus Methanoperedens sp.]KPQ42857.1 MAG: histidinol-phosphate aminotransferase [Candidatus Methanoperedens sp. BLZ1]MBZ0176978.1 histidinol-phosphate transaminase [Candidatus Methanoperedens nitroreducens]CAG1003276.1 histidinol-phosphate aminotransferase [Methanosarcinales archaeon]MCX9078158.1 histidinol-phosphate transaminase [Candidatus Methanoperedens sp.]